MKIISLDSAHFYHSSPLMRGVQTFTSLLSDESQFIFLKDHLERLLKGADFLFPEAGWSQKKSEIESFLNSEFVPSHYFRIAISEGNLVFLKKPHVPKPINVALGNATSFKNPSLIPSFVKSADYLLADLELRGARKKSFSDVVFFDQDQRVTEASTSNIFVVVDDKNIVTPKTSSMVLDGITRKKLIEYLKNFGFHVSEGDVSKSELEVSREIWLTNSIQGMRVVSQYEQKKFDAWPVYQKVSSAFGRFGEKFNHE